MCGGRECGCLCHCLRGGTSRTIGVRVDNVNKLRVCGVQPLAGRLSPVQGACGVEACKAKPGVWRPAHGEEEEGWTGGGLTRDPAQRAAEQLPHEARDVCAQAHPDHVEGGERCSSNLRLNKGLLVADFWHRKAIKKI